MHVRNFAGAICGSILRDMDWATSVAALQRAVRSWDRKRLDVPVCMVVQRHNGTQFVSGRLKDLSPEGAGVYAGVELRNDAEIHVEFTPAFEGLPLRVRAVVRNRRGYRYGLEFISQTKAEETALNTLRAVLMPVGSKADGTSNDRAAED